MAIQKQVIMGRLYQASGEPIGAGFVRFTLNRFDATDNGVIAASQKIEAEIETDGSAAVELWPNTAGDRGTFYTVTLLGAAGNELEKYGRINIGTDGPYQLADLLLEEVPPAATSYWMSLTEAEFAAKIAQMDARVSTAETARDIATTARDTTLGYRDAAQGYKNAAHANAQDVASAIVYQNLAGVMASYGLTLVDAFVYDTTRDFMGGLWRYQTSDKSWFDEEGAATGRWLGAHATVTAARNAGGVAGDYYYHTGSNIFHMLTVDNVVAVTRGSRKDHPANALLTIEAGRFVIWDGDDPSLPMWKVIRKASTVNAMIRTENLKSVTAINGIVCLAGANGALGLMMFDFPADRGIKIRNGAQAGIGLTSYYDRLVNCNEDDWLTAVSQDFEIADSTVNDVAMTVLPGAEIDPETGMPIPTIAVATDGGVSVIRDDGRVVNSADTGPSGWVTFTTDGKLFYSRDEYYWRVFDAGDYTGNGFGNEVGQTNTLQMPGDFWARVFGRKGIAVGSNTLLFGGMGHGGTPATATVPGLNIIEYDFDSPANSWSALITSDYTTGWVGPNNLGCWLSSTDASDLTFDEVLSPSQKSMVGLGTVYGGLVLDDSGYSDPDGGTNAVKFTHPNDDSQNGYFFLQGGKNYTDYHRTVWLKGTGSISWGSKTTVPGVSNLITLTGSWQKFEAFGLTTGNGRALQLQGLDYGSEVYVYDPSVTLRDQDRGPKRNGLIVHGTIARTPVAPGAELMGYSGFTPTSYLEQPYNPDLDFGTGDFCTMGWVQWGSLYRGIWHRTAVKENNAGLRLWKTNAETVSLTLGSGGSIITAQAKNITSMTHICVCRRDGNVSMYFDGSLVAQAGNASSLNLPNSALTFGGYWQTQNLVSRVEKLALWKFSATAPSQEQIAKIYRDEKKLFQPGAACTLYGTSDAVTALAHDDTKGLDLVGTSDGLSRFKGLLRVSHGATPITTTIAAGAGFEVTQ